MRTGIPSARRLARDFCHDRGMDGAGILDYHKSSRFAYRPLQRLGLEIPRLTWFDWMGFLAAWMVVGGLVGLLIWLAEASGSS